VSARTTRTAAILEVSSSTYEEIAQLLREAGYSHAFIEDRRTPAEELIDMDGIALRRAPAPELGESK
jgi:signal recognition particle subunit SEC65